MNTNNLPVWLDLSSGLNASGGFHRIRLKLIAAVQSGPRGNEVSFDGKHFLPTDLSGDELKSLLDIDNVWWPDDPAHTGPWESLPLTTRARKILLAASAQLRRPLRTIADVSRFSEQEILSQRNCGISTLENIQEALHTFGLKLA